jgi:phthalate 4,5-dioxygenase
MLKTAENGIRCIYHGWLRNGRGRCVEQRGEPAGSTFKDRVRTQAYPCHEAGGLILAYLGLGDPPELPGFHFLFAPNEQTFTIKVHSECNYLQANEGNIDPQHLSYLHRFLRGATGKVANGLNEIVSKDRAPEIHATETAHGIRISTARAHKPGTRWARIAISSCRTLRPSTAAR